MAVTITQADIAQGPDHLRQVLSAGGVTATSPANAGDPVLFRKPMRLMMQNDGTYLVNQEDVV